MRLIKASYEILPELDVFQAIERAGRLCYKSEDKITADSAKPFVDMLIQRKHTAMLEHGTIYLKVPTSLITKDTIKTVMRFSRDKYTWGYFDLTEAIWYFTTNYRVIQENGWEEDLKYRCECTDVHEKRISVKLICDRGVSHEIVRQRLASFAQESTRYCNYSNDKFGGEISCILPLWITDDLKESYSFNADNLALQTTEDIHPNTANFLLSTTFAEKCYFMNLHNGWTPQQARDMLPTSTKTEIIITASESEWELIFGLRAAPTAHPQMRELMIPLQEEFLRRGLN